MFIVMPIEHSRQAPEERHGTRACQSVTYMPLPRSLAGFGEAHYYEHGAPKGACRRVRLDLDEGVSDGSHATNEGCPVEGRRSRPRYGR